MEFFAEIFFLVLDIAVDAMTMQPGKDPNIISKARLQKYIKGQSLNEDKELFIYLILLMYVMTHDDGYFSAEEKMKFRDNINTYRNSFSKGFLRDISLIEKKYWDVADILEFMEKNEIKKYTVYMLLKAIKKTVLPSKHYAPVISELTATLGLETDYLRRLQVISK